MSELSERLEALASRNAEPLPVPTTWELPEEEAKERFLDLLAEGEMPETAALKLGKTGTWFRRRRSERSASYDEAFAEAYEDAMRPDGFHRDAVRGKLRAALMKAVEAGDMRAIKLALQAFDPEFSWARPMAAIGNTNVEQMLVVMGDLPTPLLRQVREALVSQQKALPDVEA